MRACLDRTGAVGTKEAGTAGEIRLGGSPERRTGVEGPSRQIVCLYKSNHMSFLSLLFSLSLVTFAVYLTNKSGEQQMLSTNSTCEVWGFHPR